MVQARPGVGKQEVPVLVASQPRVEFSDQRASVDHVGADRDLVADQQHVHAHAGKRDIGARPRVERAVVTKHDAFIDARFQEPVQPAFHEKVVIVEKRDPPATRQIDADIAAEGMTAVDAGLVDVAGLVALGQIEAAGIRAVVHHDDLVRMADGLRYAFQRTRQLAGPAIGGNDQREFGCHGENLKGSGQA